MIYIDNILFAIILTIGVGFFVKNVKKLIRNIKLGQDVNRTDNSSERWKNMAMIALGQSKMVKRPVSGILHIIVYVGFTSTSNDEKKVEKGIDILKRSDNVERIMKVIGEEGTSIDEFIDYLKRTTSISKRSSPETQEQRNFIINWESVKLQ
jgi:hypothetical protein